MRQGLSSRGLAALSVLVAGSASAKAGVTLAPNTVVVAGALTPSPAFDAIPNPDGLIADSPSTGMNRLLLPAVQKYNAIATAASPAGSANTGELVITPHNADGISAPVEIQSRNGGHKINAWRQIPMLTTYDPQNGAPPIRYTANVVNAPLQGDASPVTVIHLGDNTVPDRTLAPFGTGYSGGVRVATGDLNGDGIDDIIASGLINGKWRKAVVDGKVDRRMSKDFIDPSDPGAPFGGSVAIADLNGDGKAEIVCSVAGSGPGGMPHVKVYDSTDILSRAPDGTGAPVVATPIYDFELPTIFGAADVYVTAGDLDGDGRAEIVCNRSSTRLSSSPGGLAPITILRLATVPGLSDGGLEVAGLLSIPFGLFGSDYTGDIVAVPSELDATHNGQELVLTAFSGISSVPEPGAALPLLVGGIMMALRRRRTGPASC